jgi:hypothetical protein
VELSPCAWTVTPDVLAGKKVEGGLLGGVIHPALEKHRRDWSEIPGGSLDDSAKAFVSAVSSIAPYDNFAARAIFVSGGSILSRVSLDDLRNLLHLTKPRTWDAPHALQYYEQEGFFRIREAWLSGVVSSFTRAFRIAERGRDQEGLARMASQVACGHIEIGEMEEAAYWLGKVRTGKNASSNLMIQTSRASFLWNDGHGDLALDTMNDARAYLPGADQASIARFWVNYSLLSAEVGGSDISERGTELTRPASPTVQSILEVARATQLASKGKLYDSIDILGQTLQTTLTLRHRMDAIYVEEALAEVLARAGRSSEAKNTWLSAQAKRSAKLNPRNLARYRRIRSLCS